jgi:hypothetical protein
MNLKIGGRYVSQACDTEVIVVKAPGGDVELRCAGQPMAPAGAGEQLEPDPAWLDGSALGKRYTDAEKTIELLVVKPGAGTLALDGTRLEALAAKALPSSD